MDIYILLCAMSFVVSLVLTSRGGLSRRVAFVTTLLVCLFLTLWVLYWVADVLTGNGIDESVVYHLMTGLKGAGFADFGWIAATAVLLMLIVACIGIVSYRLSVRQNRQTNLGFAAIPILAIALVTHPVSSNLILIGASGDAVSQFDVVRPPYQPQPTIRPNLVFIYLESFERTYLDESRFPGLTPRIRRLERESLSFVNVQQFNNTSWTIAGLVATQCGLPLIAPKTMGNSLGGFDRFMPGAICLGDLLESWGYELEYVGAADPDFAGKRKFLNEHGFSSLTGTDQIQDSLGLIDAQKSSWGISDEHLFHYVEQRVPQFSAEAAPFALFALTLDTHHPYGFASVGCRDLPYLNGSNPILNSVRCADEMVYKLVRAIQMASVHEPTYIVIASDHLAMPNSATDLLSAGPRRNLLLILGPQIAAGAISRSASTFDVAPTLLEVMGLGKWEIGLGRSLLSASTTYAENFENDRPYGEDIKRTVLEMWGLPKLASGVLIDAYRRHVRLGDRTLEVPVLLEFDDMAKLKGVSFQTSNPTPLAELLNRLDSSAAFIWVDRCEETSVIDGGAIETNVDELCVVAGRKDKPDLKAVHVADAQFVSDEALAGITLDPVISAGVAKKRNDSLIDGDATVIYFDSEGGRMKGMIIKSSGYGFDAYLGRVDRDGRLVDKRSVFKRGVTIFEVTKNGPAKEVTSVDTCLNEIAEERDWLHGTIRSNSDKALILVAYDTMTCGPSLDGLFSNVGLSKYREVGTRTPYAVIIEEGEVAGEFVGEAGRPMIIRGR